jgi:hypothetical protein
MSKKQLPPFIALFRETLVSPAWRNTSHGARSLYTALKAKWSSNLKNNGRIYLSQRDAMKELGSNRTYIARWFRELQHYGFIVMTTPGCLGVDGKGKAPHWRLTECGYGENPATRDFNRWDGSKFQDRKRQSKKQNPGPQTGATLDHKLVPVVDHKLVPPSEASGPQTGAICDDPGGPQTGAITSLPLGTAVVEAEAVTAREVGMSQQPSCLARLRSHLLSTTGLPYWRPDQPSLASAPTRIVCHQELRGCSAQAPCEHLLEERSNEDCGYCRSAASDAISG